MTGYDFEQGVVVGVIRNSSRTAVQEVAGMVEISSHSAEIQEQLWRAFALAASGQDDLGEERESEITGLFRIPKGSLDVPRIVVPPYYYREFYMPDFYKKGDRIPYMPGAGKPLLDSDEPVLVRSLLIRNRYGSAASLGSRGRSPSRPGDD